MVGPRESARDPELPRRHPGRPVLRHPRVQLLDRPRGGLRLHLDAVRAHRHHHPPRRRRRPRRGFCRLRALHRRPGVLAGLSQRGLAELDAGESCGRQLPHEHERRGHGRGGGSSATSSSSSSHTNTGAIVGGVVGGIVGFLLALALVGLLLWRRRRAHPTTRPVDLLHGANSDEGAAARGAAPAVLRARAVPPPRARARPGAVHHRHQHAPDVGSRRRAREAREREHAGLLGGGGAARDALGDVDDADAEERDAPDSAAGEHRAARGRGAAGGGGRGGGRAGDGGAAAGVYEFEDHRAAEGAGGRRVAVPAAAGVKRELFLGLDRMSITYCMTVAFMRRYP
ncbi:uncharacterized protein B0H18DRAFT_512369 [Fomitopsis serialis]|uniref:uncharacterized protein n=1 Tax=Fomitopsis serialis TaxID=139415 RepID=UPI0020073F36|nr:uncharacterized protein B0H18DRAFT_512369 [Neoantrodia serialis]KAH9922469.1 hypothetical protein B0H18DRAFT_512369 [Neoantrodia serialis]